MSDMEYKNGALCVDKLNIDDNEHYMIDDPDNRIEILFDASSKVISYRKDDGTLVENAGVETNKLSLTDEGIESLKKDLNIEDQNSKKWYLPEYGIVNIKEETFYLTSDERWSTKDDVECIQMYDDTPENASQRITISYYYIKSTLTPLPDGTYDRTSVNENSVRLELVTGKDAVKSDDHYYAKITKVNGTFYLTSTLEKNSNGVYSVSYIYGSRLMSVPINYTDSSVPDQTTLSDAYEITPITDVPPYKAWPVTKKLEHYCIADINFGTYYNKTNVPVSIKYQGSGSLNDFKRGFRITFYKKNDFKKKDKIKIGEMLRLSGFNMKSYYYDRTLIKDPIMMAYFIEMWETRGKECYPWCNEYPIYSGATGMIKSFPIETYIGGEIFGLQSFGLKKDEKNYLLDGDDDASGIFVSGGGARNSWKYCDHTKWLDEMMDEMSQETADALDVFGTHIQAFINGTIEIDGQDVEYTPQMFEEHVDIASFIDYYIGLQLFLIDDNLQHNVILYSGPDKVKFYAFFYDLDAGLNINYPTNSDIITLIETMGTSEDVSLWKKLKEVYKDSILNRYVELRKTVLTYQNIKAIHQRYTQGIPPYMYKIEKEKWGRYNSENNFENVLNWIKQRLKNLDKNYFNLDI